MKVCKDKMTLGELLVTDIYVNNTAIWDCRLKNLEQNITKELEAQTHERNN